MNKNIQDQRIFQPKGCETQGISFGGYVTANPVSFYGGRLVAAECENVSTRPLVKRPVLSISTSEIQVSSNDVINELLTLIETEDANLKNIEVISFADISQDNVCSVQKLLDAIFMKEALFTNLKRLTFGNIDGNLAFPKFKWLETLVFKDVWGKLLMADFPMLKNIEYGRGSGAYGLEQFKAALRLRGLSKIQFKPCISAHDILSNLLKYPGDSSNLKCIETIVIDPVRKGDF